MEGRKNKTIVFRQWSNKRWAILASFHKVIVIATLSFSYGLLAQGSLSVGPDSVHNSITLELEEVEVAEDLPAQLDEISLKPVYLVSSRKIEAAAATGPEDLLEYLPQVDIRQRGKHETQADLSIQAGTFDQSMVLLNGINISDPQTGHFHLNLPLDLHAVRHMEVVGGASARRFGSNAFSGAVNIVTHPADSNFIKGGFKYGQHAFYKAHMLGNLGGKKISTFLSLNTAGSNGYRENTDFRSTHGYLHSATKPGKFRLHLMAGLNLRAFGANAFYSPLFINQYEETKTGLLALRLVHRRQASTWNLSASLRLGRDHFLLDRYNPSFYFNDHLTIVSGINLNGKFSSALGVTQTGLNYRREEILSTSLGEVLEQDAWVEVNDSVNFTHGHVRDQWNWNVNHTYSYGPFTLSGGMLVHLNADMDYQPRIYPGIDLKWKFAEGLALYTSVNRSMRLPTFTDLYYQGPSNVGNPQLTPERATTLELGVFRERQEIYFGLNGFYRQGRDMIDWIWMEDEKWHTLNLTRIDALGSDFQVRYTNHGSHQKILRLENAGLSYTFTHLSKVSQELNSRYLLDNLRHKVVAEAGLRFYRRLFLSLKSSYQQRNGSYMLFDPESGQSSEQPYKSFVLLDAKLSCSLRSFQIFVEGTNLLNAEYNDIGNIIQPGTWFMAGFEFLL